ncbi:MAG: SH3 domain-containing protein [Galactobacter sp.]
MKPVATKAVRTLALAAIVAVGPATLVTPAASAATAPVAASQSVTVLTAAGSSKAMVTTAALNLRKGASTKYKSLGVMKKGAAVTWTGKTSNGWKQVKWGKKTGWASGSYLKVKLAAKKPAPAKKPAAAKPTTSTQLVTTSALNLRAGASTKYKSLGVMKKGAAVTWTGKTSNGWKQVKSGKKTGWASGSYLKAKPAAKKPAPAKKPAAQSSPGRAGIPAYSQTAASVKNKTFGGVTFGRSGCVPTSFAMVAKSYGKNVTPLSVGAKMYEVGDFNRTRTAGAGGKSIVAAGKAYGLKVTPLHSPTEIKNALLKNKPVLAALRGPSSVINPGYTHEVVLNGYSNGTTMVTNPLGARKARYNVNSLYEWRSFDKLDLNAGNGATFWQIG